MSNVLARGCALPHFGRQTAVSHIENSSVLPSEVQHRPGIALGVVPCNSVRECLDRRQII